LSGVFSFITDYHFEPVDLLTILTLVALEAALSFDNAAVLAAMVHKLPQAMRRKALLYGLGGAYLFRIVAILGVSIIIANPWLKLLGGAYLIYLMVKHLLDHTPHSADVPRLGQRRILGLSPFWSVVLAVELMDVAFALDQIVAAVGLFTGRSQHGDKRLLIILAAMIAILLLRISAYYVGKLIDWFPRLETFAYLAVGWVGIKLVVVELADYTPWPDFDVPQLVSVGVTMMLLVVPVLVKWLLDARRKRRDIKSA
jgi:YkoY family integral membrane protein